MRRLRILTLITAAALAVPLHAYYPFWTRQDTVALFNIVNLDSADFNGDGRDDVITRTSYHAVHIFLTKADGSLTTPASAVYRGSYLSGMAAADVDGNGTVDAIVSDSATNSLIFLPGNGDGTLGTPIITSLPLSPSEIVASDLTGDGKIDVAFRSYSSATLNVYAGDGMGNFSVILSTAAGENVRHIETGDIDDDGHADLALGYGDDQPYKLFFGRGDGTFDAVDLPSPGPDASRVHLADLDGDGDLEILVCYFHPKTLEVLVNNGSRAFAAPVEYSTYAEVLNPYAYGDPVDIAVGDVDGDGDGAVDVMVTLANSGAIAIFPGNGNGTLRAPRFAPAGVRGSYDRDFPHYMILRDYTGDGRLDIALAGSDSVGIYVNSSGEAQAILATTYPTITQGQPARFAVSLYPGADVSYFYFDEPLAEGTITLEREGQVIGSGTLIDGRATIEVASLSLGTHSVTARYSGSDEFRPATSTAVTQKVVSEATITTLTSTATSGEMTYGSSHNVIAKVTSPLEGPLNGSFWLYTDGVRGQYTQSAPDAYWSMNRLEPGTHEFYVTFEGTANQPPSRSNLLQILVKKATTTTTIQSPAQAYYSSQNYFSAEVSSGRWVSAQLKIYEGNTLVATIPGGSYVSLNLPVGVHYLRAVFEGNERYEPSQSAVFEYTILPDQGFLVDATAAANTIHVQIHDPGSSGGYYRFYRRVGTDAWAWQQSYSRNFTEYNAQPGVLYAYRVEKYSNANQLMATSNTDVAMVRTFTDHPLMPGTPAKAVHLAELVSAANVFLAAGAISPVTLDQAGVGGVIRAQHLLALRNAINEARAAAGMTAVSWSSAIEPGGVIRAAHVMELRNAMR